MILQLYLYQTFEILKTPIETIFYLLERTSKEYRKFVQRQINCKIEDITFDQSLVLYLIIEKSELSQSEIGSLIFKDNASISRMVELMIKNDYLVREMNKNDRRKYNLTPTQKGKSIHSDLKEITVKNRKMALNDISKKEILQLSHTLNKIMNNCQVKI